MKYSGRTIAFVTAGAASSLEMIVVSANPRQEKANAPTARVTSRAGIVWSGSETS
jgi:hypothetical protein